MTTDGAPEQIDDFLRISPLPISRKLAFLAIVGAAGLGALEVGARWASPEDFDTWRQRSIRYTSHPAYHWRMQPGDYAFSGEMIHVNRWGLRGTEPVVPKPAGTTRILILGGSAVFNAHAEGGRTWPVVLQEKLNRRMAEPIEVINAGVPGYGIYQSAHRYAEDLHLLDADIVVVDHLWNDLKTLTWADLDALQAHWAAVGANNEVSRWMREDPLLDFLSQRVHLASKVRMKLIWRDIERQHIGLEGREAANVNGEVHPEALAFCVRTYRELIDRVRSHGSRMVLVDQPLLLHGDSTAEERERIHYGFVGMDHERLVHAIATLRNRIAALATSEEVPLIPAAMAVPSDLIHFRNHVHLTQAGIEAISDSVADALVSGCGEVTSKGLSKTVATGERDASVHD